MIEIINAAAQPHPIDALLAEKGIRSIGIVDDAFDRIEDLALRPAEIDDLWGRLEFADSAQAELKLLGCEVARRDDVRVTVLAAYYPRRDQCPNLTNLIDASLVGQRIAERLSTVKRIAALLGKRGLVVEALGRSEPVMRLHQAQVIFMDWYLGDGNEQDAIDASVAKVRQIIREWPATAMRPVIVLMSSQSSVTAHADEFRRRSGLLAGMFYAIKKDSLSDPFTLQMHLQLFATSFPAVHTISKFTDALQTKIGDVGKQFIDKLGDLTLSDYALIQRLSLQEDGQPLGDYLLWLLGGYFSHLLFSIALSNERAELDATIFEHSLPTPSVPSSRLAEIFQCALFDMDVGHMSNHPLGLQTESTALVTPALSLGDVFAVDERPTSQHASSAGAGPESEARNVQPLVPQTAPANDTAATVAGGLGPGRENNPDLYMVINAQCDLAFSPVGARRMDPFRSIMLLPGLIHPLGLDIPNSCKAMPSTELFTWKGEKCRILWDVKKVVSIQYRHVGTWLSQGTGKCLDRVARLRLPYALELQRAFTADLMRVGMPVAPPIFQTVTARTFRIEAERFVDWNIGNERGVFLVLSRDGPKCVLTLSVVKAAHEELQRHLQQLRRRVGSFGDNLDAKATAERQNLSSEVDALARLVDNHNEWVKLLSPLPLPAEKPAKYLNGYLQFVRQAVADAPAKLGKAVVVVSFEGLMEG